MEVCPCAGHHWEDDGKCENTVLFPVRFHEMGYFGMLLTPNSRMMSVEYGFMFIFIDLHFFYSGPWTPFENQVVIEQQVPFC